MNTRTWHPGLSLVLTLILSMLLPRVASAQTPAGAAPNAALSAWMATTDPKDNPPAIPREFRGVWVATVANIDWPSKKGLPSDQQQAEMRRILDRAVELKLNAILLQVRPSCDAIYPSSLEPWSEFLTGQSGKPPSPEYDPLAMWIEEAHARGLELHAWVNPFRSRHFRAEGPDAANHINIARPDLVRKYDNLLWLDPGEPEAQEHSLRVIMDLVNRYDLDGVHYDDYFYPYPKDNVPFPDDAPFARARAAGETRSKADWRRANIDNFVRRLYEQIKKTKPHVKVGISPFGIWRPGHPPGIAGFDAYEGLSADARLWLREGWCDYFTPQLYWALDARQQSYTRLLDWWIANNDQRRHMWPGNNTSRVLSAETPEQAAAKDRRGRDSWEPAEIVSQIEETRARALGPGGAGGNVHFSMTPLMNNHRGIVPALTGGVYKDFAVVPASPWLARGAALPQAPAISVSGRRLTITPDAAGTTHTRVLWQRSGGRWRMTPLPRDVMSVDLPAGPGAPDAVAIIGLDRVGRAGPATVLKR